MSHLSCYSSRKVQLTNIASQGNILDSHFYVSHKFYKEVLGYVDVFIKRSTIALAVIMMLRILAISPHPKLLSNFLLLYLHWFVVH
jgi:hypothetical protein